MKINTKNLEVGKMIFDFLNPLIPCYPIIAEKSNELPFCLYRKLSFQPNYTKDKFDYQDNINMEIKVCASTYNESIELAQKVKELLEMKCGNWRNKIIVDNITMINGSENFIEEPIACYVQTLIFQIDLDSSPY